MEVPLAPNVSCYNIVKRFYNQKSDIVMSRVVGIYDEIESLST